MELRASEVSAEAGHAGSEITAHSKKSSSQRSPKNSSADGQSADGKSENSRTSDNKPAGPSYEPVQESGLLNVGISYNSSKSQLELTILNVKNIPTKDRGAPPIIQVRLLLLPARVRRWKTKVQNTDHRVFNEVFRMRHITPNELDHWAFFQIFGTDHHKSATLLQKLVL